MLVIGIDPGTARTGYGLVETSASGALKLIHYGVITTPAKQPMTERLIQLHQGLKELLSSYKPQMGAVEQLFFQKNLALNCEYGQFRIYLVL